MDSAPRQTPADGFDDSGREFRTLVESTAAIVWSVTPDGVFSGEQPGWSRFTGQGEAEYSGWGWTNAIHPDDRERSAKAWNEANVGGTRYFVEHRLRRHDGEWRDMLANAVPIRGVDGAVERWIGSHTDITAERRLAAALDETNLQFAALADNIAQLAWMARPDGTIVWCNRRWFDYTGWAPGRLEGADWASVHHPDHIERVRGGFYAAVAAGRPWEDTFPLRAADGSYRWFLAQAVPVREAEGGEVQKWFGTHTDVTRQRAQEHELALAREEAENANRAKSEFIANMSHELRTPLSAVIGYAEMLEEEAQESGETGMLGDLAKINGNARHLLSLINNVLDLSKIEAERMEVFLETFAVSAVVADICAAVQVLMAKKGNRLVVEMADDLGDMHTDQVKLRQCVINLLSNAAKFCENGTVTLEVRRATDFGRDWLTFDVRDTGIGMAPEQLQKLFQRFAQADSSTTRRFGGTGLGLAITKAFCKLLGGDIAVTSREGEGSAFTVKLPAIATATVVETAIIKQVPAAERAASQGVVLAVDDDPSSRDLVSRFLTREGFIVRTASDGLSGLETARAVRPDVILLDVTMPRMDGWSVLTALKGDAELSAIPVVMLTVIDQHSLGFALGASDYLLKPVQWGQLRKVLDRFAPNENALVLAVDDDRDLLARMRGVLEKAGLGVLTAENGREALALLETRTPDLILTDLVMPEMDGFAFIRAVRARPATRGVPIVVLTSKNLSRQEFQDLRRDTDTVLSKRQVDLPDLLDEVRELVGSRRQGGQPLHSFAPAAARETSGDVS
ncbi:PAS domain-containing hybrid sensor histidine kinase/response regulator [Aureimonas leprariae]|uniref:histidine kinase n=1 Tax=Plantimonas leprariae TaxID=2615207 RepID=A0A7V7TXD4_9HYPH|nr:PAS domain-containing hybrid sensor histidine kinase/response regulator [Aureimonas leprariae]KAB0681414.1 response regulator [Aureimonas leprariae]